MFVAFVDLVANVCYSTRSHLAYHCAGPGACVLVVPPSTFPGRCEMGNYRLFRSLGWSEGVFCVFFLDRVCFMRFVVCGLCFFLGGDFLWVLWFVLCFLFCVLGVFFKGAIT